MYSVSSFPNFGWIETTIVDHFEPVTFVAIENEDDLILSFFIAPPNDPTDGRSLILSRRPKWETLFPEHERGVTVTDEAWFAEENRERNVLARFQLGDNTAVIECTYSRHKLDLSRVDRSDLRVTGKILKQMNFDKQFKLEFV